MSIESGPGGAPPAAVESSSAGAAVPVISPILVEPSSSPLSQTRHELGLENTVESTRYSEKVESLLYDMGLHDIPLSRVPVERAVSSDSLAIAQHERNHLLLAVKLGATEQIDGVSVMPQGNTLGYVSFRGLLPDYAFSIISAGGVVNGTGDTNDRLQIMNQAWKGGYNPYTAVDRYTDKAREQLNNIPDDLKVIVDELIAFKGYVPGHEIPDLLLRAQFESECKSRGINLAQELKSKPGEEYELPHHLRKDFDPPKLNIPEEGGYTVIVVDDQGQTHLNEYLNGKPICPKCRGIGAHMLGCQFPISLEGKVEERSKEDGEKRDGKEGKPGEIGGTLYTFPEQVAA